jgi:MinD superfamily P-loop ATPase
MKQLVIISGKGGTGKTTIAASFSWLAKNATIADCDVEAPNLHMLIKGRDVLEEDFIGARAATIDGGKCTQCGLCQAACRFDAIHDFTISELGCEGCGTCQVVCPDGAVTMKDQITGINFITECNDRVFSHARLEIGADGSGKLVTKVRKRALDHDKGDELVVIDGSPGIGCTVIASITGCDAALLVTEPTRSGLEDLIRALSTCDHFGIKSYVCINKYDLNACMCKEIEAYCTDRGYDIAGRIPYDGKVLEALKALKPVILYRDSPAAGAIGDMYRTVMNLIRGNKEEVNYDNSDS